MRMKLWAGRASNQGTEVIFPIFDLLPSEYSIPAAQQLNWNYTVRPPGASEDVSFQSLYIFATDAANLYKLFPADIPRICTDPGNIIMTSGGMEYDSGAGKYVIADSDFTDVSGTEPGNWDSDRYRYYYYMDGGGGADPVFRRYSDVRYNNDYTVSYEDVFKGVHTAFDPAVTYHYNNNEDPRKNICQMYTAATGSSFGILRNFDPVGDAFILIGGIYTEFMDAYYNQNYGRQTPFYYSPFTLNPYSYYPPNYVKMLYGVEYISGGVPISQSKIISIFVSYEYNGKMFYGMALVTMSDTSENAYPISMQAQLFSEEYWGDSIISGGSSGGNWGADTVIDGGNGTFSATSDPHGDGTGGDIAQIVTSLNTASGYFAAQGGINIYRLDGSGGNISGLTGILQILFSSDYFTKFLTSMYNPLSAVLSAHLLPQALTTASGTARHVTAGGFDVSSYMSGSPSAAVADQFTQLHFAPIDIPHFSDSFADFAPYTSAKLHLPYCGVIDIDINKCMGGKLGVDYVCDAISGNVAAWVWVSDPKDANSKQYAYVATGNAAYSFPMFAETQSGAAVGKLIGAAGSAVIGAATGNPFAAAGALSAGLDAVLTGHNTQISGTFSGNVGILTDPLCWLEITRPLWVQPSAFQQLHGITSQLSGTLADSGGESHTPYSGYVVVSEIDLVTVNATDAELQEIERLLKSGVFIRPE